MVEDWQQEMDLRRWRSTEFYQDYSKLVVDMGSSHGEMRVSRTLDFAELLASHMMLQEAHSAVDGVTPETEKNQKRQMALRAAILLLRGRTVEDFDDTPLAQDDRPDSAFWKTLNAISEGDPRALITYQTAGFGGVSYQSAAVVRGVLPALTEAAIETGNTDVATIALRLLDEIPDLSAASVGDYLRGRYAQSIDNDSTALKHYLKASGGFDRDAAKARLALAEMAIEDGGQGALLAARDTLADGASSWRGDSYELRVLYHLARLNESVGDDLEALLVHAQIMARFGLSDEAKESRVIADRLTAQIYAKGADDAVSLSEWMRVHLRIMPFLRFTPEFALHTETLADRALVLGGTELARKEYERALSLVESGRELTAYEVPEGIENRLRLKIARAHYEGGRYRASLKQLSMIEEPADMKVDMAAQDLRAKAYYQLGNQKEFLQQASHSVTSQRLRRRAMTLADQEEWGQAKILYKELMEAHPNDFDLGDAVHLLIAAKRTDDEMVVGRVTYLFPELTKSDALLDLAKGISIDPEQLTILGSPQVAGRLERYDDIIEVLSQPKFAN